MSEKRIIIARSQADDKKYKAVVQIYETKSAKWKNTGTINFGAKGYSDFTKHKDKERRMNYLKRHGGIYPKNKSNNIEYLPTRSTLEDWTKTGMKTAGFYSRYLLWNKTTLKASALDIEERFKVSVIMRV